jgi:hypothetical protein
LGVVVRSRLVFSKSRQGSSALVVDGEPDAVVAALREGWAQLNTADSDDGEPEWVWVNADRVLYVERESEEHGRTSY